MLPQLRLVCQISMFPVLDEAFDWHTYCHQSPAGNEDGDGSNQEKYHQCANSWYYSLVGSNFLIDVLYRTDGVADYGPLCSLITA